MVNNKFIVMFLILILSHYKLTTNAVISSTNGTEPADININANQTIEPYLELSENITELGNSILIKFGMIDNQTNFLDGFSYNLTIFGNNSTEILKTGNTVNVFSSYRFETLQEDGLVNPGNYSIFLITNSSQGIYNQNSSLSIIAKSGVDFVFQIKENNFKSASNEIYANIGIKKRIDVNAINVGTSNSFSTVISYKVVNEPVGLDTLTSQEVEIPLLLPLENITVSFEINSTEFGLGEVEITIEYTDGKQIKYIKSETISIITQPLLAISLELPEVLILDESSDFNIIINNLSDQMLYVSIQITSDLINFPLKNIEQWISEDTNEITFQGIPTKSGFAQIEIRLWFFDQFDGIDMIEIGNPLNVGKTISIAKPPIIFTTTQIILGMLVLFNAFVLIFIIFLYYKQDIRKRILKKLFKIDYINELEYPSDAIIVDGSNIAWEEVNKNGKPQISNIHLCIKYLKEHGFTDILVLADAALRYQIKSTSELDDAAHKEIIKVLPAKVNADTFILRLSAQRGSLILSNDLFKEYREEFPWIDERRVPYTIMAGVFYLHPLYKRNKK